MCNTKLQNDLLSVRYALLGGKKARSLGEIGVVSGRLLFK